ncbi:MAG: NAD(P)-binding domain-containing protein [Thiolinea sp.]
MPTTPHIAFLGTGLMGAPMATNLLKAGFAVTVWNRTPAKQKPCRYTVHSWLPRRRPP